MDARTAWYSMETKWFPGQVDVMAKRLCVNAPALRFRRPASSLGPPLFDDLPKIGVETSCD